LILIIVSELPIIGVNSEQFDDDVKIQSYVYKRDYCFEPGIFIVKFKELMISSKSISDLNKKHHILSIEKAYTNVENTPLDNIYYFYLSGDADILAVVEEYASLPNVEYVEPNYIIKIDLISSNINSSSIKINYTKILNAIFNDPDFVKQTISHYLPA
jgi:hypothetical protein